MNIYQNKEIRLLFLVIAAIMTAFLLISQIIVFLLIKSLSLPLLLLSLLVSCGIIGICLRYFFRQNEVMEDAVSSIDSFLAGDKNARISCDDEGDVLEAKKALFELRMKRI